MFSSSYKAKPSENNVCYTTNLESFKLTKCNRDIRESHVSKLLKSMSEIGFLPSHHIIIDSSFNIIDGQHRFLAAKRLGTGIYYMIDPNVTPENLISLNDLVCKWRPKDRIKHYSEIGNSDYQRLLDFAKSLSIPYSWVLDLLSEKIAYSVKGLNEGDFKFTKEDEEKLRERLLNIKRPFDFLNQIKKDRTTVFGKKLIIALDQFLCQKNIDLEKFMHRLEVDGCRFNRQNSVKDYKEMFEEIYKFRSKKT